MIVMNRIKGLFASLCLGGLLFMSAGPGQGGQGHPGHVGPVVIVKCPPLGSLGSCHRTLPWAGQFPFVCCLYTGSVLDNCSASIECN